MAMARHLRDPEHVPGPEGVEARRLKIYQDLIYKNIAGFISGGFPVLRSLYADDDWHALVRIFIDQHRCHSPYFLEISQEFLHFLMEEYVPRDCDPPFMAELAHYEWVELALDVSEERLPDPAPAKAVENAVLALSPLAWSLAYRYPVHRIGPGIKPEVPGEPCYLAVYRDRSDAVQFLEVNAATSRLLALFRDNSGQTVAALLEQLADELGAATDTVMSFGLEQVTQFLDRGLLISRPDP